MQLDQSSSLPPSLWRSQLIRWLGAASSQNSRPAPRVSPSGEASQAGDGGLAQAAEPPPAWPRVFPGL